jgi:hypothetical protein
MLRKRQCDVPNVVVDHFNILFQNIALLVRTRHHQDFSVGWVYRKGSLRKGDGQGRDRSIQFLDSEQISRSKSTALVTTNTQKRRSRLGSEVGGTE